VRGAQTLCAAGLLLLTACGGYSQDAEQPAEQSTVTTSTERTEESGAMSYSLLRIVDGGPSRPPADLYSVFARPPTPADERAGAGWELLPFGAEVDPAKGPDLGRARAGSLRRLLGSVEGEFVALVAVLTTTGAVCFGLEPDGGGSCGFPPADGLDLAGQEDAQGLLVYGMVPDGVDAVDLVAAGQTTRAKLGENGFAARLRHEFSTLEAAVLHRRDGKTERIQIGIP
jgi:hypothetical protein